MEQFYTKDQFWRLYETLPKKLQDALWAEETGNNIYEICAQNSVKDLHAEILHLCTAVLVGLLLPQEFEKELQKRLKIKKDIAREIARQINRFVFYPVKPALEQLYLNGASEKKETGRTLDIPTPRHDAQQEQQFPLEKNEEPRAMPNEQKSEKTDPYRESIE